MCFLGSSWQYVSIGKDSGADKVKSHYLKQCFTDAYMRHSASLSEIYAVQAHNNIPISGRISAELSWKNGFKKYISMHSQRQCINFICSK